MSAEDNPAPVEPPAPPPGIKYLKNGKIDPRSTPEFKAACAARLRAGQARKNEYLKAGKELLNRKVVAPESSDDDEPDTKAPINSADFALWLEFERFRLAKSLGVAVNAPPAPVSENKPAVVERPIERPVEVHAAPVTAVDMTPSKPIAIPARPVRKIARF